MFIVVENGKLIQQESPGYLINLFWDRWTEIVVPLEFYLKDNNGRILTKGNYRGKGDIVQRDGKKIVVLNGGSIYGEEYEVGDVTKESDDFYTGVLWGVYKSFVAQQKRKGFRVYADTTPEPREKLPHTAAAREGVKFGESEFKRLFGRQKKMRENPTKMSAGVKKVLGSRSFKSPVLQARGMKRLKRR